MCRTGLRNAEEENEKEEGNEGEVKEKWKPMIVDQLLNKL